MSNLESVYEDYKMQESSSLSYADDSPSSRATRNLMSNYLGGVR